MTTSRFAFSFTRVLVFALICVGAAHYSVFEILNLEIDKKMWALTYFSNFLLASLAILMIYKFRISHTASLGYIFLATSLLKLIVFPLFIQPVLVEYCPNSKQAFILFFVPYLVALIVEIRVLIKLLNRL